MFLLAALASTVTEVPHVRPQTRATVRIARAVKAAREEWVRLPLSRRREKIIIDGGRELKVRLIEIE
jgi:hypothetical protein